jgi:nitroreductase
MGHPFGGGPLGGSKMLAESDVLKVMEERHSSRETFDPQRHVRRGDLQKILEAARWAPTAHNMQNFEIVVVDDPHLLKEIGRIETHVSEAFLRENYQQLSDSEGELRHRQVGILGTLFPASWKQPDKFEEVAREAPSVPLHQDINGSPMLLLVVSDTTHRAPASMHDELGRISLGCVMENMWLAAQSVGLTAQILSVFGGEPVETETRRILGIPSPHRIIFAVRLGYPAEPEGKQLRVRREVGAFVHYNGYGEGHPLV